MKKIIDIDELGLGKINPNVCLLKPEYADGWNAVIDILENAPTADVPDINVGKWVWSEEEWAYTCSACGTKFDYDKTYELFDHGLQFADYCPACGAKMKGGYDAESN